MKQAVNMSLNPGVLRLAHDLIPIMRYGSISALVEQLIRNEYERRVQTLTSPPVAISRTAPGSLEEALETGSEVSADRERSSAQRKARAAAKSKSGASKA